MTSHIILENGDIHEGEIKDGRLNGNGKITFKMNGRILEGKFKDGYLTGKGKLITKDIGDQLIEIDDGEIATIENGYLTGKGKITFSSGNILEGEFKDNKLNGNGKKLDSKKRYIERGTYENGKLVVGIRYLWNDDGTCYKFDVQGNIIQDNIADIRDKLGVLTKLLSEKIE